MDKKPGGSMAFTLIVEGKTYYGESLETIGDKVFIDGVETNIPPNAPISLRYGTDHKKDIAK